MEIFPDNLDPMMIEILRSKSPAEKLEMAAGLCRFARELIRRTIVMKHPEWSEDQINREVASRISHGIV